MRIVGAALAALALSGCASTLTNIWDGSARRDCERLRDAIDRQACLDRAEDISRNRDRSY